MVFMGTGLRGQVPPCPALNPSLIHCLGGIQSKHATWDSLQDTYIVCFTFTCNNKIKQLLTATEVNQERKVRTFRTRYNISIKKKMGKKLDNNLIDKTPSSTWKSLCFSLYFILRYQYRALKRSIKIIVLQISIRTKINDTKIVAIPDLKEQIEVM